jgi:hypothetical protein
MLVPALIGIGLVTGLAIGRWWAFVIPATLGVWIGVGEEVDVPGWYLGLAYAGLSSLGVAVGVVARRLVPR